MNNSYESWGRFPKVQQDVHLIRDIRSPFPTNSSTTWLPYGLGRSYGDSCLNDHGTLLDTRLLDNFLAFDEGSGLLRAEAGVSLESIIKYFLPLGWFLPVSPGTKYVTLGGALANDIHGKNHHQEGSFGCHVHQFGLVRSNGERLICSPTDNPELFKATIGGLGLTGLITWVELSLKRIPGEFLQSTSIKFKNLDEFLEVSATNDPKYEYTVSWVDCLARGEALGRGIYMGGNFTGEKPNRKPLRLPRIPCPIDAPHFLLSSLSIRAFNTLYYARQRVKEWHGLAHYEPFFYPLDSITGWNKLYGKAGLFQYQCIIPPGTERPALRELFEHISNSSKGSFLAVLKRFGNKLSPGMLSFPRPGITLALNFKNDGLSTLDLFDELDRIVVAAGGAVYPAKDARMSPESFKLFYPAHTQFAKWIDPRFSSSFWRRVSA